MPNLVTVTAPTGLVLSVEDVMAASRVEDPAESGRWERLILAATEMVQHLANYQLLEATYRLELDRWPVSHVILPRSNFGNVTQIQYRTPSSGALVTLPAEDYQVVSREDGSTEIWPPEFGSWPSHNLEQDAIQITYTSGSEQSAIPAIAVTAVEQLAIRLYEDPTCGIPAGIVAMIGAFRVNDARLDVQMAG